ncbi:unnamed protein product [Meganyctiphanes norvegica]|uniref:Phospholipid/glycerol acyltransferase domain-containing protein n=1 Tax=Meganyctiphanes norvegica TaxID=48144 RepID=A0AAV2QR59_MEGNR
MGWKSSTFVHLLYFLSILLGGFFINIIQALLFFTLKQINKDLYHKINYYLTYGVQTLLVFLVDWWCKVELRLHMDDETNKEFGRKHALITLNHTYEVDMFTGWLVAERTGILGATKGVTKKSLAYLPTIGWTWRCSDYIVVNRNFDKDKEVIQKTCNILGDYPFPTWMAVFPEGTRFTATKHAASMEFAQKSGIPTLKRHLIPRTRGFVQLVQSLKGKYPVLYDYTISYNKKEGAEPRFYDILCGKPMICEIYIRQFNFEDLPDDDEGISEWLQQLFREKDELLDSYINTGSFTAENTHPAHPVFVPERRPYSLLNTGAWAIVMLYLLVVGAATMIKSGVIGVVVLILGTALAFYGLQVMISLTRVDKASQYGISSHKNSSHKNK